MIVAVLALLTLFTIFIVGMRRKSPAVLDAVRRINKGFSNPKQMATAGTVGAYASIVEHVGRTSGKTYRTPVGTETTDDGYLVALPYGTRPDWVKNVLAAGSAVVTAEGETVAVDSPEIVAADDVARFIPDGEKRMLRLFNVTQAMTVRRSDAPT